MSGCARIKPVLNKKRGRGSNRILTPVPFPNSCAVHPNRFFGVAIFQTSPSTVASGARPFRASRSKPPLQPRASQRVRLRLPRCFALGCASSTLRACGLRVTSELPKRTAEPWPGAKTRLAEKKLMVRGLFDSCASNSILPIGSRLPARLKASPSTAQGRAGSGRSRPSPRRPG